MPPDAHKNFAYSTVATAPSPATSGTSLVVASGDGTKFPAVPFNMVIWPTGVQPSVANSEIVRVTAISTDTLTITRAQEGTSARTVVVGDQLDAGITAKTLTDAEGLGLTPTAVKTSNYTAVAGDFVPCDTATTGSFTVTLPTAPVDGTIVAIKHVLQSGARLVTVALGGSDVLNSAGGTTSLTLPYLGQSLILRYKSSGAIWYVMARDDAPLANALGTSIFGDGSDGTVTFDGSTTILGMVPSSNNYTLSRDFYFAAATINVGVSIFTNGYRIYCAGALVNNGNLHFTGQSGSQVNQGNDSVTSQSTINSRGGGNGGINASGGFSTSTTGGNGTSQGGNGQSMGGVGGTGGAGAGNAAGTGGSIAGITTANVTPRWMPAGAFFWGGANIGNPINGGSGGGAGGGDGSNRGGGGGASGGVVAIYAKTITGTGTIQARGGAGGSVITGNVGGGGGGGGGFIMVVSQSVINGAINGQTVDANGGAGGTKNGTGVNGSAGSNGNVVLLPG